MNHLEFERRYWPLRTRLMRTALALLGNGQEAEDAVQETFLRVWRQGERLDDMASPEGFFLLTLRYCGDTLIEAVLDGKPIEI